MTPVCPFVKAARPDDPPKPPNSVPDGDAKRKKDCPSSAAAGPKCPSPASAAASVSPKCPFGFDSQTFKLGPLSCMICQALLFQCAKCVPCSHLFCKVCISRFEDCPLCGADIDKVEDDANLQATVDRFIQGHARIKRSHVDEGLHGDTNNTNNNKKVIYEDVSLERGAFLVQQAMRAFRAQNVESAKSRLTLCADDIRTQIETASSTSELCSQLGAVLGMLGDCCRATGDASSAVKYFEESVEFLGELPRDDLEITHTLSVSLNKIGDLKYYDGDLKSARSHYLRSLVLRQEAMKEQSSIPSQALDVAVSLAKVADVDRTIGNEDAALDRFREAIGLLESLTIKDQDAGLEQRRLSVLEFLNSQLADKQSPE